MQLDNETSEVPVDNREQFYCVTQWQWTVFVSAVMRLVDCFHNYGVGIL